MAACQLVYLGLLRLQDLSLGRLHCEPDEIYVPTVFAVRDLTDLLPASLEAQVCSTKASLQPASVVCANL